MTRCTNIRNILLFYASVNVSVSFILLSPFHSSLPSDANASLHVHVFDENTVTNTPIGEIDIALAPLAQFGQHQAWFELHADPKNSLKTGAVLLKFTFIVCNRMDK